MLICAVVLTLSYYCVCKLRNRFYLREDDDYEFEGGMRTRVRHEVNFCFFKYLVIFMSLKLTKCLPCGNKSFREAYKATPSVRLGLFLSPYFHMAAIF